MSAAPQGRGRLSSFELMPSEADHLIAEAAQELSKRERTQVEIYRDFVTKCERLMAEHHGELEFAIPAFSSFNRFSIRMARMTRRLDQTKIIVAQLAERFDPADSDNLTIMAAESLKALVLGMMEAGEDGLASKDAANLATALRQLQAAQNMSSDRRRKMQAEMAGKIDAAAAAVADARGLTPEVAEDFRQKAREIMGFA